MSGSNAPENLVETALSRAGVSALLVPAAGRAEKLALAEKHMRLVGR
ncbi:MAG: hypothetical protein RLZZ618_1763 [Pseudomonadota bacterium]|jgi:hypothetical protein